jgi:Ca2+/Na+ antiporter
MLETGIPPEAARRAAASAVWTFPAILSSAFIVAWAAECAQFYISQGLALALLAWVQVLPEFAVEATIAWHQNVPLMTANFTGALRLPGAPAASRTSCRRSHSKKSTRSRSLASCRRSPTSPGSPPRAR